MNRSTLTALIAVVTLGGAFLWWSTDELRAFTTEGARRLAVAQQPRDLPETVLEGQDGALFGFDDYRGRRVLVEFIYTRCPTVCGALGQSFERIAHRLPPERLGRDIVLLSVSFDPEHDDPAALRDYAQRFPAADGRGWRMARVNDPVQLARLLRTFGIVVIPDGMGGFEHNAAIHLVGPDGRLARIYEAGAADRLAVELVREQWTAR